MHILLRAHELSSERGGLALFEKLSLELKSGDLLQLVGPNGCGKTTLLRLLSGLSLPLSGNVVVSGPFLYQGHKPALKDALSAMENLQWYCPSCSRKEIMHALTFWRLRGYEAVRCGELSAGQQQKVALCRLMLDASPLWLLDEPFASLDQDSVRQLEQCFVDHAGKGGAVIFTSHLPFSSQHSLRTLSLREFAPTTEASL